jgi:hypothetical protein
MTQFCDRVDVVMGPSATLSEPQAFWTGWSFGTFQTFSKLNKGQNGETADFRMTYEGGDAGFPCLGGRSATVDLYCSSGVNPASHSCPPFKPAQGQLPSGSGNGASRAIVGDTPGQCPNNISQSYCACDASYSFDNGGCNVKVALLIACPVPSTDTPVFPPDLRPTREDPTAGEVIGYLILALAIAGILFCAGGTLYNMKAKGKSGLDAVPCSHVLRPSSHNTLRQHTLAPDADSDDGLGGNVAAGENSSGTGGYGTL